MSISARCKGGWVLTLSACLVVAACGKGGSKGGEGSQPSADPVSVSGTVLAPNGQVAFHSPTGWGRILVAMLGSTAHANIAGLQPAVGVTVTLIQIDADGTQVGTPLASATTNGNGQYSLAAPSEFVTAPHFVVRASGASAVLDAMVTDTSGLIVDPVSHVTKNLVVAATNDLANFTIDEIKVLRREMLTVAQTVDPGSLDVAALTAALAEAAGRDEVISSMVSNATSSNATQICGHVSYQGAGLAGITILVRDFRQFVKRASTTTDSAGNYCVAVTPGDYVLGALNFTDTSFAASEWWTTSGTVYNLIGAEKTSVVSGTITRDFVLETGGRIEGRVSASGGSLNGQALEGVEVEVRHFRSDAFAIAAHTDTNGRYRVNVFSSADGYYINTVNTTWRKYASQAYTGTPGGSNSVFKASKLIAVATATQTVNLDLEPGNWVSGQVRDGAGGPPVVGTRVRINVIAESGTPDANYLAGGPSVRLCTDGQGRFGVWLKPAQYSVQSYGQRTVADLRTGIEQSLMLATFDAAVGRVRATIRGPQDNPASLRPVAQAKVFLYDASSVAISQELSDSEGEVELYAPANGLYRLQIRVDRAESYASLVYHSTLSNPLKLVDGEQFTVTVGAVTQLGPIDLPVAGILAGVVYLPDGTTRAPDARIQVRTGGTDSASQFLNVFTRGDGSYEVSLPVSTYTRVRAGGMSTPIDYGANTDGVSINASEVTTRNFTLSN